MSTAPNPFLNYLDTHPGAGAEEIKRLFRILAKRTHPDTGSGDKAAFVEIQKSYHAAVAVLLDRELQITPDRPAGGGPGAGEPSATGWHPSTSRELVLHLLYRYKTHLPSMALVPVQLPQVCLTTYAAAIDAAARYGPELRVTLEQFGDQFHTHRAAVARYPDVVTKYKCFLRGFASFFDYLVMPNEFNRRVALSYFDEIRPVTNYDPLTSPALRTNRSAPARAALYRFSRWTVAEMDRGPCRIV